MIRAVFFGVSLLFFAQPVYAQSCAVPPGKTGVEHTIVGKVITFYVPHNAPNCANSIEGCIATSCPGLKPSGVKNSKGQDVYPNKPTCLDAVRLGEAKYVTVASAASNYGKYYNLGTITYRSALDNQMYTVQNVVGYVHDTGCAFNGTCSASMRARFGFSSVPRPDKLDICTTVCPTCTDAQAGALAQGKNVAIQRSNAGAPDPVPTYANTSSPFGASPFSSGSANPFGGQNVQGGMGARGVQGAYGGVGAVGAQGTSPTALGSGGSIGEQLLQGTQNYVQSAIVSERHAATLLVSATEAGKGTRVLVSWATVGMKTDTQCKVVTNAGSADVLLTTSNNGSQLVEIPFSSGPEFTVRLHCSPQVGVAIEKKAQVTVQ